MKIFVGSLPFNLQEEELRSYFEEYGAVSSATIVMDKATGRSRGFAFVEMDNDQEAQKAIQALNKAEVAGRTIVVNQAEEKRDNTRGSGYGNRNNQGGYNSGGYNHGGSNNRDKYNKGGGKDRY